MAFIPGLRFRKSIGILPGVKVNLSKTGVSTSLGGRGATVNVGTRSRTVTLGIPGTGLSYRMPLGRLVVVRDRHPCPGAGRAVADPARARASDLHWWQPKLVLKRPRSHWWHAGRACLTRPLCPVRRIGLRAGVCVETDPAHRQVAGTIGLPIGSGIAQVMRPIAPA